MMQIATINSFKKLLNILIDLYIKSSKKISFGNNTIVIIIFNNSVIYKFGSIKNLYR